MGEILLLLINPCDDELRTRAPLIVSMGEKMPGSSRKGGHVG